LLVGGNAVGIFFLFWNAHSFFARAHTHAHTHTKDTYVVGSKSFQPDIQKLHQMANAVRDI
jgi:hypothetical protein